jgi:diacylglycerol kinase family enzyme
MPDARPDDGLLDVAVLQTRTVLDWLALAARVLLRRRRDPQLELFQARRVEIGCDRPQPVERDGDPLDTPRDHLMIAVIPKALTLCVPRAKGPDR